MGKKRTRLVTNSFFRDAGMLLLLLIAADLVFELTMIQFFYQPDDLDPLLVETNRNIMFRGLEYLGSGVHSFAFLVGKWIMIAGSFLLLTVWVYRGMRNLRAMGIHSHLEPSWIVASWIIAPLLIVTFPIAVRDTIEKNCRIYDLLGRKPGDGLPAKGRYQRIFTQWWVTFWGAHAILMLNFHELPAEIAGYLFSSPFVTSTVYYLIVVMLTTLPLLLGARFLYHYRKMEDAVLKIADSGKLEQWRDQKLQAGQLHADFSDLPDWYAGPEDLVPETGEHEIFSNYHSARKPANPPS